MIQTVEGLAQGAIELPPDQRLTLAQRILASVEPTSDPKIDAAWVIEIRERIRRYDLGETCSVPGSEVFAGIDRLLAK